VDDARDERPPALVLLLWAGAVRREAAVPTPSLAPLVGGHIGPIDSVIPKNAKRALDEQEYSGVDGIVASFPRSKKTPGLPAGCAESFPVEGEPCLAPLPVVSTCGRRRHKISDQRGVCSGARARLDRRCLFELLRRPVAQGRMQTLPVVVLFEELFQVLI
jgi:hypothetical protein